MYKLDFTHSDKTFTIKFDGGKIFVNDNELTGLDISKINDKKYHILKDYKGFFIEIIVIDKAKKQVKLRINDKETTVNVKDELDVLLDKMGMSTATNNKVDNIKAPMPGLVLAIKVAEGDTIEKGSPLVILEAMKMENIIKSAGGGVVKKITVKEGQAVEKNELLIEVE